MSGIPGCGAAINSVLLGENGEEKKTGPQVGVQAPPDRRAFYLGNSGLSGCLHKNYI